jgi:AbrB family looped-hinge helix DNA binding protein
MSTNIQASSDQKGNRAMSRVTVREAADITLPQEAREKLRVAVGDELDVEVVEDGVLLRPVGEREKAWDRVFAAMSRVQPAPEQAKKSLQEQEEEIYDIVEEFRHRHA